MISEVLANRSATRVGDPFEVRIGPDVLTVPVVGVIRDYRTRGGVAFYSLPHFFARFGDHRLSGIRFFLHVPEVDRRGAGSPAAGGHLAGMRGGARHHQRP